MTDEQAITIATDQSQDLNPYYGARCRVSGDLAAWEKDKTQAAYQSDIRKFYTVVCKPLGESKK